MAEQQPASPSGAASARATASNGAIESFLQEIFYYNTAELRKVFKADATRIECTNAAGWTPLLVAAWHHDNPACVTMLLDEYGCELEPTNENGWTPLMAAVLNNRIHVIHELLLRGANAHVQSKAGKTPKQYAQEMGNNEIVEALELAEKGEHGLEKLQRSLPLQPYTLWYIVSCPSSLQKEVLSIVELGRCIRLFPEVAPNEQRSGDEAWKLWRTNILMPVLSALKAQPRTPHARLIFLEDKGSKLCKDEWNEWAALKKAIDFQLKALQREREAAGTTAAAPPAAGGAAAAAVPPPNVSIELYGDGVEPTRMEDFLNAFGPPHERIARSQVEQAGGGGGGGGGVGSPGVPQVGQVDPSAMMQASAGGVEVS